MTSEELTKAIENMPYFVVLTVDEWNALTEKDKNTFYRIMDGDTIYAVYLGDKLLSYEPPKQAIAVQDTDGILWFDYTDNVPNAGGIYTVTLHGESTDVTVDKVFTDFADTDYYWDIANDEYPNGIPAWTGEDGNEDITAVAVCDSFKSFKPKYCGLWFYMLWICESIDVSNLDTSECVDMVGMFVVPSVTTLDVSNFNTANVTNMYGMFTPCTSLTTLDVSSWDTSNVTDMGWMFTSCTSLTTLDVSNFNTANVTNMYGMFTSCTSLTTIYSDDDMFVTTAVTSGSDMFYQCTSLVGGNGTAYSDSHRDYDYAHIDTADNPGYFTAK